MSYTITRSSDSAAADFISLNMENPNTSRPVVEPLSRPNVDGLAFRVLANKGVPYRVRGLRNFKNEYAARTAIDVMRGAIVGQLIEIDINSQIFDRLMVLEIREVASVSVVKVAGGLTTTTSGLWGGPIGSSVVPGIGILDMIVVHVGEVP